MWLVIGFLCVGPFILPLCWVNPNFSRKKKLIISLMIIVLSVLIVWLMIKPVQGIILYYQQMHELLGYPVKNLPQT